MNSNFPVNSEMAKSELIKFHYYSIFLRKDDIIQIQLKEHFVCEVEDVKNMERSIKQLSGNKKHPLLSIYPSFNSYSKEALAYVSKLNLTSADALVGSGALFNMIGNFYLKLNKPVRPSKLFNNTEDALEWLQQFLPPTPL